jgi:hypothetical protein
MSISVVLILSAGLVYRVLTGHQDVDSAANFDIHIPAAAQGWQVRPHGPQTYFLYAQPQKGLLLRGSVNQMVDDINPTPDLNRDGLAHLMVDNTLDNMPGWTAVVEDTVDGKGTSFRIVRRSEKKHVVVTAFAVRGNTTLLVSLSGRDGNADQVDKDMTEFRSFLSNVGMTKADNSKW